MDWISLLWLFFIISSLTPVLQQRWIEAARMRLIQKLERQRRSRVITLIHRQETLAFLGIPFSRYIDIDDSEEVLRAIRLTPEDMPIDLIVHTPGGLVLAAEQIAHALLRHRARVTVFVPHYAMSGGTLIALAADEIVMDPNAVLGPVDPQLGEYPAAAIVEVVESKPIQHVDDRTLILASVARKALRQVHHTVCGILRSNGMPAERAEELARLLSSGTWTHDYPINYEEARMMGLPVSEDVPADVYALMSLYPQPRGRRPSVQYIPMPYAPQQPQPAPERGGSRRDSGR
jgi:ClpP class serine protease